MRRRKRASIRRVAKTASPCRPTGGCAVAWAAVQVDVGSGKDTVNSQVVLHHPTHGSILCCRKKDQKWLYFQKTKRTHAIFRSTMTQTYHHSYDSLHRRRIEAPEGEK